MGWLRKIFLFCIGGFGYVFLEILWRGRSHGSMFLAGGSSFLLLGWLGKLRLPLWIRGIFGAGVITTVELAVGMLWNRRHHVWDYRQLPWNLWGQICLPFSLLWLPLGLGAMGLYRLADRCLRGLTSCKNK